MLTGAIAIYDLDADIAEKNNLTKSRPDIVAQGAPADATRAHLASQLACTSEENETTAGELGVLDKRRFCNYIANARRTIFAKRAYPLNLDLPERRLFVSDGVVPDLHNLMESQMMRKRYLNLTYGWVACAAMGLIGCAPSTKTETAASNKPPVSTEELEHMHSDDHAHASTYAEAITHIEKLNTDISAAFTAGKGVDADAQVHEIGHALEDVISLAKKSALSEEDQVAVGTAVESLLDAFGKIDEKLHGGDGANYEDVATDITTAMDVLKKFVGEPK